jgi:hypothetical protein
MNFNFSHKNDYALNTRLIDELIRLYGVESRFILTEKKNLDEVVFGDWSSIKTNNQDIFDVHLLPASPDDIDRGDYMFSDFGFNNFNSTEVFISAYEVARYGLSIEKMMSSLIVLPSNQIFEVTDVEHLVPGMNNLWAYSDAKSAFKLTLRVHEFKAHDETEPADLVNTLEVESHSDLHNKMDNYDALDGYFETLLKQSDEQDYEAEVKEANNVKEYKEPNLDEKILKPIYNTDEKDPFGWES